MAFATIEIMQHLIGKYYEHKICNHADSICWGY